MGVLASAGLPSGEIHDRGATVLREPAVHHLMVADESRHAVRGDLDGSVPGIVVVKDIVEENIAGARAVDVEAPAGVRRHDDGVDGDDIVDGPRGGIQYGEDDATRMIVIKQVVFNDRVLHATQIDGSSAGRA